MALTNVKEKYRVTKEIRLFHLGVLLTSLNICSDYVEEHGNGIWMIYYSVLSETWKNELLQWKYSILLWKKLRCNIIRKREFNGANFCIYLFFLLVSVTISWYELIFMKRIKIPRAEICDVMWRDRCLHKKLAILWLYDYGCAQWMWLYFSPAS